MRQFCKHIPAWEQMCLRLNLKDIEIHILVLKYTIVTKWTFNVVINQLITRKIYLNMSKENWLLLIFSFSSLLKSQQSFVDITVPFPHTNMIPKSAPISNVLWSRRRKFSSSLRTLSKKNLWMFFHFCVC